MNDNRKLARNTIMLYVRMFVTLCISLYTSRVVLRVLGFDDFGIYNVVCGVVAMFSSISGTISSASSRFLMVSIGKHNTSDTCKVFNLALLIHVGISLLILLLCEAIGLYFLYHELVIPDGRMNAAFWILQFTLISLVISFISLPYNSLIVAHEDMDIFAYITMADVTFKLLIVFFLQYMHGDKLILYGLLLLFVQIVMNLIYFLYCKWKYVESALKFFWDFNIVKEMFSYTVWMFWGFITGTVYAQGLNILLNVFYGPVLNAAQGIAIQVQGTVQRFSVNFQTAIQPQITKSYVEKDTDRVKFLVVMGSKISFFLMFIIALPISLQISTLLSLWLGDYPPYTESFVILLLINCIIRIFASPLMIAVQADGDIKKVQLWEGTIVLTLIVSYIALKFGQIEPYVIYIINVFFEIVVLFIRVNIVLSKIRFPWKDYIIEVCWPVLKILFTVIPISYFFVCFLNVSQIPKLILSSIMAVLISTVITYFLGLSKQEQQMARELALKTYRKFMPKG